MQPQRLDFKEFIDGMAGVQISRPARQFLPSLQDVPEPPPPPPSFSEEELKAAERDGYKRGFIDGTQEGRTQAESEQAAVNAQLSATAENFVARIAPLFDDYRRIVLQMQEHLPKAALAIARKVAGNALDQSADKVIEEIALRTCETMSGEMKLSVTVHESLADTMTRKLEEMAPRLPAATDIVVMRDPNMPLTDCRIEWKHGSIARDTAKLWEQVEQAVENMSLIATREAHAQLETIEAQVAPKDDTTITKE